MGKKIEKSEIHKQHCTDFTLERVIFIFCHELESLELVGRFQRFPVGYNRYTAGPPTETIICLVVRNHLSNPNQTKQTGIIIPCSGIIFFETINQIE